MKNRIILLLSAVLFAGLLISGCELTDSSDVAPSEVQVQMQIDDGTTAPKLMSNTEHENVIEVQRVKMFVDEMELESVEEDSLDFEVEYQIVDLPLDGTPLVLTEQLVPAGLYDEFELEIEKPDDEDVTIDDTDFRDETGSYSLVISGLYNGEEFSFRSSEDFELEIEVNPPLEISDAEGSTLTISVDVSSWFKDSNGETLDPKDYMNTEMINENIENSFEGFEDEFDDDDDDDDDD